MEKKTKELLKTDKILNAIDGKYYPLESIVCSGAGYIIKLSPAHLDGNTYYAGYLDRHQVESGVDSKVQYGIRQTTLGMYRLMYEHGRYSYDRCMKELIDAYLERKATINADRLRKVGDVIEIIGLGTMSLDTRKVAIDWSLSSFQRGWLKEIPTLSLHVIDDASEIDTVEVWIEPNGDVLLIARYKDGAIEDIRLLRELLDESYRPIVVGEGLLTFRR